MWPKYSDNYRKIMLFRENTGRLKLLEPMTLVKSELNCIFAILFLTAEQRVKKGILKQSYNNFCDSRSTL